MRKLNQEIIAEWQEVISNVKKTYIPKSQLLKYLRLSDPLVVLYTDVLNWFPYLLNKWDRQGCMKSV